MFKDQSLASNSQHKSQACCPLFPCYISSKQVAAQLHPTSNFLAQFHPSIQPQVQRVQNPPPSMKANRRVQHPYCRQETIDEFKTTFLVNFEDLSKPTSQSSSRTSQNLHSFCILRISKIHWSTTWTKDHRVSTKAVYKSVYNYKSTSFCCCNQFCGYL